MALEDKTEAPTDQRRREARRKGQVGKSMELSSSLAMVAGLVALKFMAPGMFTRLKDIFVQCLTGWPVQGMTQQAAVEFGQSILIQAFLLLLPVLLIGMGVAMLMSAAQVGLVLSGEPLAPQLNRLDPVKGLARMFSKRMLIELGRSILKVLIVGWVIWITLRQESSQLTSLANSQWLAIVGAVAEVMWKVIVRASAVIVIIAGLDYFVQRKQHEKELRMTKQELKEELKRTEGDPTTRGRIRQIQRDMGRRRMMTDVANADVVVTNPIHFAVALKYDAEEMGAPKVLAKGQNLIAEKIKELAEQNDVPVVQNIPLARSLFKSVEVGQEVPLELYQAVAEVLAAVYRMKGRAAA